MRKFKFLIPSVITLIILGVIFYFNGFYPFGDYSIVKVDADYQYIPVLYRIYDFLHGNVGIIYSDIGFGNNIYISMIIQGSIFSPVNLLLYFTSRNNIVNFYNILVATKLCLITLTSYIYLDKRFKVDYFYKIIGSILYAFSGFMIFNYFNIMWLDCVVLFPLIIMYLEELLNKEKYVGYIITLSLSLIITYYISYYILVFIVFYSFVYIFLNMKKNKNIKKVIYRLGISTVIAILISSFSTVPAIYQTIISSRFNSNGFYTLYGNVINKSLYVLFSPFFILLSVLYISKYKTNKVGVYRFILLLFLYIVGVFVEPINLLMHGGSYWDFPFRYGFVTTFILMIGSFNYISQYKLNGSEKYSIIKAILFSVFTILLIYFSSIYMDKIVDARLVLGFKDENVYYKILIIILFMTLMYAVAISFGKKELRYFSLGISCVISIYIICNFTMYHDSGYFLSINANSFNSNVNVRYDGRYKLDYTVYSPDYGFVLDVDTLDNWLHVIPDGEVRLYSRLGYETSDTCIRSYGSTVFMDWLLNVKYLISKKEKDNKLYEFLDSHDGRLLYEYKYNRSNGIVFNGDKIKISEDDNPFTIQNKIYKNLFNTKNDIVKIDEYVGTTDISYKINKKGILYFIADDYTNIDYIQIGEDYTFEYDNYVKEIGMYDKDIMIHVQLKGENEAYYRFGFVAFDDILSLDSDVEYSMGEYYVDSNNDDNYLFLPVNNIKGLSVYLNDKKVDSEKYLDNFVLIKLSKGENHIKLKYNMPYFYLGIILSIVGLVLFILYKYLIGNNFIYNIGYYLFIFLTGLMFLYFYFYSMIKYFINT